MVLAGLNNWFRYPVCFGSIFLPMTAKTLINGASNRSTHESKHGPFCKNDNCCWEEYSPLLSLKIINLLAGGGAGDTVINKSAALHLQPALEAQCFVFGLDCLGFNTGVGLDVTMGSGETWFYI